MNMTGSADFNLSVDEFVGSHIASEGGKLYITFPLHPRLTLSGADFSKVVLLQVSKLELYKTGLRAYGGEMISNLKVLTN